MYIGKEKIIKLENSAFGMAVSKKQKKKINWANLKIAAKLAKLN